MKAVTFAFLIISAGGLQAATGVSMISPLLAFAPCRRKGGGASRSVGLCCTLSVAGGRGPECPPHGLAQNIRRVRAGYAQAVVEYVERDAGHLGLAGRRLPFQGILSHLGGGEV